MMSQNYILNCEAQAARSLLAAIANDVDGDEQAVMDAVEGETNFYQALDQVLSHISECEAFANAISEHVRELQQRATRMRERAGAGRRAIAVAMQQLDVRSIRRPGGTISLRPGAVQVMVDDAGKIPEQFLRFLDPLPDKIKIATALKAGEVVPGACLKSPGQIVSIKV